MAQQRKVHQWTNVTTDGGTIAKTLEFIPPTDAERDILSRYAEELSNQLIPASRKFTIAILAKLANHWKNDRSPQEWKMLFEDYCDDLSEFSEVHIEQAIRDHRRTSQWFPAISQIRIRCEELQELTKIRRTRCLRSLRGYDV